ncbi:hypothetical protein MBLNU230_g4356t1 [Neophaeotheca triangularis]
MARGKKDISASPNDDELEIDVAPTSINPYQVLSLTNDASAEEVKKAYKRAALKYHPDKASDAERETAHTKFQQVAFAYAILSDERRRKRYDATGSTEESLDLDDDDFDWATFYREQFAGAVTREAITSFSDKYKGSDEEREDVLAAFEEFEGNMNKLYQKVMLSDAADDEERFRAIIDDALGSGEVSPHPRYTEESVKSREARVKKAKKEKARAEREKGKHEERFEAAEEKRRGGKGKKGDGEGDLAALIQGRQMGRGAAFLQGLEEKYAGGESKRGKKRGVEVEEPSEDAFAATAAKHETNKTAREGSQATGGARRSKRNKN